MKKLTNPFALQRIKKYSPYLQNMTAFFITHWRAKKRVSFFSITAQYRLKFLVICLCATAFCLAKDRVNVDEYENLVFKLQKQKESLSVLSEALEKTSVSNDCEMGPASRVLIKHREHNGVGYDTGYTTLGGFVAPNWERKFLPFLDVRGHVFNDGRFASNLGIGGRFKPEELGWIFGTNLYYDFRDAKGLQPHQLGAGLEALSKNVEFRLNSYFPVASTRNSNISFDRFRNYHIIVERKNRAALPSVYGEVGIPFIPDMTGGVEFYFALGPYYLIRRHVGRQAFGGTAGGRGRIAAKVYDGIDLELDVTYDKIFHTTVQGMLSLSYPLGPANLREKGSRFKKKYPTPDCKKRALSQKQMTQNVFRNEIIPVQEKTSHLIAINPATGGNYHLIFVDNTSGSTGSFESPFPTLAQAENNSRPGDIIYVFPGDGTTTGMDQGIFLQSSQRFQGSGRRMNLRGISVPAQTTNWPRITNILAGGNGIEIFFTNATVDGFIIQDTDESSIFLDTSDVIITNIQSLRAGRAAVEMDLLDGIHQCGIANLISRGSSGIFIFPDGASSQMQDLVVAIDNDISVSGADSGVNIESLNFGHLTHILRNNRISGTNPTFFLTSDSFNFDATLVNNLILSTPSGSNPIINNIIEDSATQNLRIVKNVFRGGFGGPRFNCRSLRTDLVFDDNICINHVNSGPTIFTALTTNVNFTMNRNTISGCGGTGILITTTPGFASTAVFVEGNISENAVSGNGGAGIGVVLDNTNFNYTITANGNRVLSNALQGMLFSTQVTPSNGQFFIHNNTLLDNSAGGILVNGVFNSSTCLRLQKNSADTLSSLTQTAPAVFRVQSPTGSLAGVIDQNDFNGLTTSGTITFVGEGACSNF